MIFFKNGLSILKNILLSQNKKIYAQHILIIDPPDKMGDWCDGCPDLMYVGDKLFPCCAVNNLQEFKKEYLKEAIEKFHDTRKEKMKMLF